MINAIILAGSQAIKDDSSITNKALVDINGKTMVEYVVAAVNEATFVGKVVVVGTKKDLYSHLNDKVDAIIDSNLSIMDNILLGIKYYNSNEDLLICSCDIPFLTSEAVDDFIEQSKNMNADFCYPIVEKSVSEKSYPGSKRTYIRLKDGIFTGGNIFFVNPEVVEKEYILANSLIENRKNPLNMARILGVSFLLDLLLGRLTISKAEKRLSHILKISARAIVSEYPEIANDVDKISDIALTSDYFHKFHI